MSLSLPSSTLDRLVPERTKDKKRDKAREVKAEKAARLEQSIEKELLARLNSGTYGDIYNFPSKVYEKVLDQEEVRGLGRIVFGILHTFIRMVVCLPFSAT